MEKSACGVFGQKKTSRAKNLIRAKNNNSAAMLASEWLHHIKKHDLNKYQKILKNSGKKPHNSGKKQHKSGEKTRNHILRWSCGMLCMDAVLHNHDENVTGNCRNQFRQKKGHRAKNIESVRKNSLNAFSQKKQPEEVLGGVKWGPYKWPYNWVNGVITQ